MSVISAVREYFKTYTGLDDDAPVWINHLNGEPVSYSIIPIAGQQIVEEYLNGSTSREFGFAFQSVEYTLSEDVRLNTQEFFEELAAWLRSQSDAGTLPDMDAGQTPFKIEALDWGALVRQGVSETGVYQINCRLEYEQTS